MQFSKEALRDLLGFDPKRAELLALLDVEFTDRIYGCVHYVAAIAGLLKENCTDLAHKLRRCLEAYQKCFLLDDDFVWEEAETNLRQAYEEARRVVSQKRQDRDYRESQQRQREREAEARQRNEEEKEKRFIEEMREYERQKFEDECLVEDRQFDAMLRQQKEYDEAIAREYDPWDDVTAETYALIQSNVFRMVGAKLHSKVKRELAAHQAHDPGLYDRLADLEHALDELKQQVIDLKGELS